MPATSIRGRAATHPVLQDGSPVAIVGAGPAGSLCAYFLLDFARRVGLELAVDIYDAKDFQAVGPKGCNHCGGIVSESLVQHLAADGIVLPPAIIQRGIDSYTLHVDDGSVGIATPLQEKRIAATHRGGGPRGAPNGCWGGFDAFLLDLAAGRGARVIRDRVDAVDTAGDRPILTTRGGATTAYDLVVGATGVNAAPKGLFDSVHGGFRPARTSRTYISEFKVGRETMQQLLGDSMHVFLLDIPRLQFAALIPKGDYATLVLLGDGIDKELLARFLAAPEVRRCYPEGADLPACFDCQCFPQINVQSAVRPFADRLVLIGDVAATKLYKNGIGAAYLAARSAAATAVFTGISAEAFARKYAPTCRKLERDNDLGRLIFRITGLVKRLGFVKQAFLHQIVREQGWPGPRRRLSLVMWDTFTGSAPYADILKRMLHPALLHNLGREVLMGIFRRDAPTAGGGASTSEVQLGRNYEDGEAIVTQGETGNCMYVVQEGAVEVVRAEGGREIAIARLGAGDFFGEMALFERAERPATVRARGPARVLTVDQHTLLRQITDQPTLALRMIQVMSARMRAITARHARVVRHDRRNWETRTDEPPTAADRREATG